MKRLFALAMIIMICISYFGLHVSAESVGAASYELEQAAALGLLPQGCDASNLDAPISYDDMKSVARYAIELGYGFSNEPDYTWLACADDSASIMRVEGAVILYLTLSAARGDWAPVPRFEQSFSGSANIDREATDKGEFLVYKKKDGVTVNVKHLSTGDAEAYDNIGWPAINFATAVVNPESGLPILERERIGEDDFVHPDREMTVREAALAAYRLYKALPTLEDPMVGNQNRSGSRTLTEADRAILAKADALREAIINSPTTVTVTGTTYYVSNGGSDDNDGLTPETAWATLDKVNSNAYTDDMMLNNPGFPEYLWTSKNPNKRANLKAGDGVFFERGGEWRGMLRTVEGATYSAYGEGAKPRILGSPENGAGGWKWSLADGSDNIWVFYKDLQDCGGILLDGKTVAVKYTAYWDGERYIDVGNQQWFDNELLVNPTPYDARTLGDLQFFNDITSYTPNQAIYSQYGKLYLRCDAGNPGYVYRSIEFFTGSDDWSSGSVANSGCVIDNLCFLYSVNAINASGSNIVIRNCEIGWTGGCILGFGGDGLGVGGAAIVRYGNGIALAARDSLVVRSNYIYQIYDEALAVESYNDPDSRDDVEGRRENILVEGNLVEDCSGAGLITGWYAFNTAKDTLSFLNVTFRDNMMLNTGTTGWAHQDDDGYHRSAMEILANRGVKNILIENNTFYVTDMRNPLLFFGFYEDSRDEVRFIGNTYAQNNYGVLLHTEFRNDGAEVVESADYLNGLSAMDVIVNRLGDKTAVLLPLTPPADADEAPIPAYIQRFVMPEPPEQPKQMRSVIVLLNANIRAAATTESEIIGKVKEGDALDWSDTDDTGWYHVRLPDGALGYISPKLAEPIGD
ncbi:MAG: SH3 domain-containing protein [Oscillospiraceae bacterium]|jgi:hypothetical protein|nr:SH3 domain-containing protein [Oscillospiraceae bacterium]